jgi:4'-phosphopantetheinyl transferase
MGVEVCWLAQPGTAVPRGDEWLSESEARITAALRFPKRRADWRLGRWTAKRALAIYAGLSSHAEVLARIEVRPAPSGAPRPYLCGQPASVAVSISHSRGVGFCAVAPRGTALGCDIEWAEPRSHLFLTDYFSPDEQDIIKREGWRPQAEYGTVIWSAKESMLKALECGLRVDLLSVRAVPEIAAERSQGWLRLTTRQGLRAFQGWWRKTGELVWTIVSSPAPAHPTPLLYRPVYGQRAVGGEDSFPSAR